MTKNIVCLQSSSHTADPKELNPIFVSDFDSSSVKSFHKEFYALHSDPKVSIIPIVINSFGGSAHSLLAMIDIIDSSHKPVATVAIGAAMSCGALLLAHGTKGLRFSGARSDIMLHQVASFAFGKNEDMKNDTKHTDNLNSSILRQLAADCGKKDLDFFIKMLKSNSNVDVYLTAKEAKRQGLVDHIGAPNFL